VGRTTDISASEMDITEDHKLLVELACSTTLVPAYKPSVFNKLVRRRGQGPDRRPVVVFVICGGFKMSVAELSNYGTCLEDARARTKASGNVKYDDGDLAVITN
jgi:L-serine/L-threonine ammonia-lyase